MQRYSQKEELREHGRALEAELKESAGISLGVRALSPALDAYLPPVLKPGH